MKQGEHYVCRCGADLEVIVPCTCEETQEVICTCGSPMQVKAPTQAKR